MVVFMNKTTPQLLTEFMEGLNEMIGASGVMIHHHQDLRWEFIRKILEETKDATTKYAVNKITAPKVEKFQKKTQILMP
jgi:hypothetical protein